MRTSLLGLALLAACADQGSLQIRDDGLPIADTDVVPNGDTDPNGGGGGDQGGDDTDVVDTDPNGGGVDTDEVPTDPVPLTWTGTRHFRYEFATGQDCELDLDETGKQLFASQFPRIVGACPGCQSVFELNVRQDGWCGPGRVQDPAYRGLKAIGGGKVEVYRLDKEGRSWSSTLLGTGTQTGDTVTYTYGEDGFGYSYDVEGTATVR